MTTIHAPQFGIHHGQHRPQKAPRQHHAKEKSATKPTKSHVGTFGLALQEAFAAAGK